MNKLIVLATLGLLAACTSSDAERGGVVHINDASMGESLNRISYTGHWEHIVGRNDGRYRGTSSRSRRTGDSLVLPFNGSAVRVYGVLGPNGGNAAIGIDGRYYGTATFFASKKQVHTLVFESPVLPEGTHTLGIVVKLAPPGSRRAYVNIDEVEVLRGNRGISQ